MEQDYATSVGVFENETKQVEQIINLIQKIREVRLNLDVAPAKKITLIVNTKINKNECVEILNNAKLVLSKMTNVDNINFVENINEEVVNFVTELGEFYFLKNEVVDTEKERERLTKDLEKISSEMTLLGSRLSNPNFVNRAPAELVKKEQDRYNFLTQSKATLEAKLKEL